MKLFDIKKIEELLQQNWTKYIDYKLLLGFIINAVPLYAPNWPTIVQYKKFQGNKLTISKASMSNANLQFHADFEIVVENGVCVGTIDLTATLDGNFEVSQFMGTIYT